MDYPYELIFRKIHRAGVIRLRTAAIIISLDQDDNFEEETEPFFRTVEGISRSGKPYTGKISQHAFLYIEPKGNLAITVEAISNALLISIDKKQLKPVVLRLDLQGNVSLTDTWIATRDFYAWCLERGLVPGEVCEGYDNDEYDIFEHAYNNANDLRKFYEAPNCIGDYAEWQASRPFGVPIADDEYDQMFRENILLKMGFVPEGVVEQRPLHAKERNALLAIIGVLCNEVGIDVQKHAKSAGIIKKASEVMGVSIGETTIEEKLKLVADALAGRMK